MRFFIKVELELPVDEEGLTDEGWETVSKLDNAIWELKTDYGWSEIQHISQPKRMSNDD